MSLRDLMRALLPASAALLLAVAPLAAAHDVPSGFADLAAQLLPAVVNVASTEPASADGSDSDQSGSGGDGHATPGAATGPAASGAAGNGSGNSGSDAAGNATSPTIDKSFEQFLHSTEGPGSPDAAAGGGEMQSLGSGFVIDPSGLIVTNNHVIDGAQSMSVILSDGTALPATLVGRDTQNDIALLRVHPAHPLTAVHFGSSRGARIGDWVIAIGNPYGLGGSVTAGIISARGRDLQEDGSSDYIQTDAAINRGNSGGPLFDMHGNVIGINTAIYSPSGGSVGIGFAIPSDEVAAVVNQLRLYGKPRRGWIGAQVQSVTPDIALVLDMPEASGAVVATVAPGSPAAAAHLRPGDVILTYDGHAVPDMKAFPRLVQESQVGETAEVDYWRNGHEVVSHLVVADEPVTPASPAVPKAQPPALPTPAPVAGLGLTLSDLTPALANKYNVAADTHGVVITGVTPNSIAARQGLAAGEVVLQLGGEPVPNMREFLNQIAALRSSRQNEVLMLVQGSDETQWISLNAGWSG
jgi:serine protease Do